MPISLSHKHCEIGFKLKAKSKRDNLFFPNSLFVGLIHKSLVNYNLHAFLNLCSCCKI
jgi:hypothetical protein